MRRGARYLWLSFALMGILTGLLARLLSDNLSWHWPIAFPVALIIVLAGFMLAILVLKEFR